MKRSVAIRAAVWALASLAVAASLWSWGTTRPRAELSFSVIPAWPRPPSASDTGILRAKADLIASRNPFRLSRGAGVIASDQSQPAASVPYSAPAVTRPMLDLGGVVGGPPWYAIIEGIPGREAGVLMAIGEEVGGVRLTGIQGEAVHISGFDTTWILAARRSRP